jgi:hypothetical protein
VAYFDTMLASTEYDGAVRQEGRDARIDLQILMGPDVPLREQNRLNRPQLSLELKVHSDRILTHDPARVGAIVDDFIRNGVTLPRVRLWKSHGSSSVASVCHSWNAGVPSNETRELSAPWRPLPRMLRWPHSTGETKPLRRTAADAGVEPTRFAFSVADLEFHERVARIGQRCHLHLTEQSRLVEALDRALHA